MYFKILLTLIIVGSLTCILNFQTIKNEIFIDKVSNNNNSKEEQEGWFSNIKKFWQSVTEAQENIDYYNKIQKNIEQKLNNIIQKVFLSNLNKFEFFLYFSFSLIDFSVNKKYFNKINMRFNCFIIFLNTCFLWSFFQFIDRKIKQDNKKHEGEAKNSKDIITYYLNYHFTSQQLKYIFISFLTMNIFSRCYATVVFNKIK